MLCKRDRIISKVKQRGAKKYRHDRNIRHDAVIVASVSEINIRRPQPVFPRSIIAAPGEPAYVPGRSLSVV